MRPISCCALFVVAITAIISMSCASSPAPTDSAHDGAPLASDSENTPTEEPSTPADGDETRDVDTNTDDEEPKTILGTLSSAGEDDMANLEVQGDAEPVFGDRQRPENSAHMEDSLASSEQAEWLEAASTNDYCDTDQIQRAIEENRQAIDGCFPEEAADESDTRIDLHWQIGLDGRANSFGLGRHNLADEDRTICFVSRIAQIEFSEPDGGICEVSYPLEGPKLR